MIWKPASTACRTLVIGLLVLGCGGAASSSSSALDPTASPSRTAGGSTAAPSRPAGNLPNFSGSAVVLIEIDGTRYELADGRCDVVEYPADMGGGWAFALNLGTPSTQPDGPDYVGLLLDLPDANAPDGEYTDVLLTATVDGFGFNVGEAVVTLRDGGHTGSFTGETRPDNKPVRGTFSC